MTETETMSKLFLELSQFVPAKTARELQLEAAQADARALNENLDSMHQTNQALIKKLYDALALVGELRSELEGSRTELIEAGHRFGFYFGLSEQVKGYYTDGFAKNRDDFYGFANNKNEAITKARAFMEGKV